MFVRLEWVEMHGKNIPLREPISVIKEVPGVVVTDAKSLFDIIMKGPNMTSRYGLKEKYSVLDMLSVFQRLELCGTHTAGSTAVQLADALTKSMANSSLLRVLMNGHL